MCDLHSAGAGGSHWTQAQAAWLRIMNTNIIIVIIAISLLPVNSCDWRHLTLGPGSPVRARGSIMRHETHIRLLSILFNLSSIGIWQCIMSYWISCSTLPPPSLFTIPGSCAPCISASPPSCTPCRTSAACAASRACGATPAARETPRWRTPGPAPGSASGGSSS